MIANNNPAEQQLVGKIQAVFFENNENFYKVIQVKVISSDFSWDEDQIVITGNFAEINEGEEYQFSGKLIEHPRYGKQFQAANYQRQLPTTRQGIVNYLAGENFPGIGQKTAQKIVDHLGEDAIEKILADESQLQSLNLTEKQKRSLLENLRSDNGMQQVVIELNHFGFGNQLTATVYNHFREKTLEILHHDPYRLALEINGIGFKRADQIAEQMELAADDPKRLQAALYQSVFDSCYTSGNIYTDAETVLQQAMTLLLNSRRVSLSATQVAEELVALASSGKIVVEEKRIYLRYYYEAEWKIAENLKHLLADKVDLSNKQVAALPELINQLAKQLQISYGAEQVTAICQALQNRVFLLTGGPGTGKTTIINGIVASFATLHELSLDPNEYQDEDFPILLAAPTGRAAKKMKETTGLPAVTIHRLLGLNGNDAPETADQDLTLSGKLLIIDEMSMVDTELFNKLLAAVPASMQLVLVGDQDQLPSVGPGRVFADLLACQQLPQIRLTKIYRQQETSSIIPLAHAIKQGQLPATMFENQRDRSFIPCQANQIQTAVRQIIMHAQKKKMALSDFQILAPMYRGVAGIDHLNQILQELLNPPVAGAKEVVFNQQHFRIGDKVLHLVNSPEFNVFNGDLGRITGIILAKDKNNEDHQDKLVLDFDGNQVTYTRKDWIKIKLAYCISIHKAQGSEFKLVILPLVKQYRRMLNRNLLYTAVTRAKNLLVLLGEPAAYQAAVAQLAVDRQTSLQQRVTELFQTQPAAGKRAQTELVLPAKSAVKEVPSQKKNSNETASSEDATVSKNYHLTAQLIAVGHIDPLIGMDGLTPADFSKHNKNS